MVKFGRELQPIVKNKRQLVNQRLNSIPSTHRAPGQLLINLKQKIAATKR